MTAGAPWNRLSTCAKARLPATARRSERSQDDELGRDGFTGRTANFSPPRSDRISLGRARCGRSTFWPINRRRRRYAAAVVLQPPTAGFPEPPVAGHAALPAHIDGDLLCFVHQGRAGWRPSSGRWTTAPGTGSTCPRRAPGVNPSGTGSTWLMIEADQFRTPRPARSAGTGRSTRPGGHPGSAGARRRRTRRI